MGIVRITSEKQREALREQAKADADQEKRIQAKLREIALRELGEIDEKTRSTG